MRGQVSSDYRSWDKRGTYHEDVHAAGAGGPERQRIRRDGQHDEGDDQDGKLDVEEPERLGRNADSEETLASHGDVLMSSTRRITNFTTMVTRRQVDGGSNFATQKPTGHKKHTKAQGKASSVPDGRGGRPTLT